MSTPPHGPPAGWARGQGPSNTQEVAWKWDSRRTKHFPNATAAWMRCDEFAGHVGRGNPTVVTPKDSAPERSRLEFTWPMSSVLSQSFLQVSPESILFERWQGWFFPTQTLKISSPSPSAIAPPCHGGERFHAEASRMETGILDAKGCFEIPQPC